MENVRTRWKFNFCACLVMKYTISGFLVFEPHTSKKEIKSWKPINYLFFSLSLSFLSFVNIGSIKHQCNIWMSMCVCVFRCVYWRKWHMGRLTCYPCLDKKNLSMLRKKLWYTCHRIKLLEECYHIPYEHVQCNPMAEHLEISKYVRRKENVVLVEDTKLNLDVF